VPRTRRLWLVAALLATFGLASCLSEPTDSTRPPPAEAHLLLRADLSTTAVATLVVEVSAPDITPGLLFNIPIVAGTAVGTITLPAGSNRTIAIRGYDAGGIQTHGGSLTISVQPGANPTIAIVLTPLTGDAPIEVTLGSFVVTVTPAIDSFLIGDTITLTATILDANGLPVLAPVVWGVLSPRVASVVSTGTQTARVTAIRPGRTTVVATYGGTAGPAAVAVLGWYAAPTGSSAGDGSRQPWDLATALHGGNGKVQPGDTVWLRGGTYTSATPINSTLTGTASAPVVVRQYPGERAILDASGATSPTSRGDFFSVAGNYSTFWGFEVTDSDPNRTSDTRPNLIVVHASHVKLINLIVHDGGIGFYTFADPVDIEIYGCLAYNNGWQESVFGNGHGIYAKSNAGPVYLRDNVLFNQFGYGIHIFTIVGLDGLTNLHTEGNVAFNNGAVTGDPANSPSANILFGGSEPVRNGTLVDNMTYFSPNVGVHNLLVGFNMTANQDITVRNNYAVGGKLLLEVGRWQSFTMTDNSLFGATSDMIWLRDSTLAGFQLANNRYYRDPSAEAWGYRNTDYGFAGWQQITGVGTSDQAVLSDPAEPKVFLRPNRYEPGRANLIIYNWSRQAAVPVDLSGVVRVGDAYEIRSVQNFFGAAVASGTYGGGPVDVPMSGVTPVAPIGGSPTPPPQTGPDFGVFVVTSSR
jgi:hypothetical protein